VVLGRSGRTVVFRLCAFVRLLALFQKEETEKRRENPLTGFFFYARNIFVWLKNF
jgi:hypothetical protein